MVFNVESGKLHGIWKVPEVEMLNKGLNETNRFYNCFPHQRSNGLKFVSPPLGSSTLHQIKTEQDLLHLQSPNYLLNPQFSNPLPPPASDVLSLLSSHTSKYINKCHPRRASSSTISRRTIPIRKPPQGKESDSESVKQA